MQNTSLSYWEQDTWLNHIDFAVIGSGIVGLSCALHLRDKHPSKKIVVFEKGMLPAGASTKNAGFACFGSTSEILDDLNKHTPEEVRNLVQQRVAGLAALTGLIGKEQLGYKSYGGYEIFGKNDRELLANCLDKLAFINQLLLPVFGEQVFTKSTNPFGFKNIQPQLIFSKFEAQINTGHMMRELIKKVHSEDILIINNAAVSDLNDSGNEVHFVVNKTQEVKANKLLVATNGFAAKLLDLEVMPARAQVLITKPIPNLKIKGTFHLDRGYNYFRNIDNRILLGGGRNLDVLGETTTTLGTTAQIQNHLESLLKDTILPDYDVQIDSRWSGIMGVGSKKSPVVTQVSNHIYCGVRLGGMGVAIGCNIGKQLANLL